MIIYCYVDTKETSNIYQVINVVKNITAQHIILSSIIETNKNEPVDNGNNI